MSVEAFLEAEYATLLSHPMVDSVGLVRYSVNRLGGCLRACRTLSNGDTPEIALHISASRQAVAIDDYRYQWMDAAQTLLRRRWDNTSHFPDLPGFLHRCHVGTGAAVEPGSPLRLTQLLDHVASLVA
jgi:hypothetical protein